MDDANFELAKGVVRPAYVTQGQQALASRRRLLTSLLSSRRLPETPWDEQSLEALLRDAAGMDSNNAIANVGVGEREGRVACPLVSRRHFHLAHGMGRSGQLVAEQPKAAGSTLLVRIAGFVAADALVVAGLPPGGASTLLPVATGMAVTLCLLALKRARPGAGVVLWPRCDQKTCLAAVAAAGLRLVVVPNCLEGDEVRTDVDALRAAVEREGAGSVLCVATTSSCFAPRAPDKLADVAALCEAHGVPHLVNNAYGLQSPRTCALVSAACRAGRVDAVVQSTDKNFMVPVGGSLVWSPPPRASFIEELNGTYPGRASISPLLDVLITLLHFGRVGWRAALNDRERVFLVLRDSLSAVASAHGERLLATPHNPISVGMTLSSLAPHSVGMLGSMLFSRAVSGTRACATGKAQEVCGTTFHGYGQHIDDYPVPYLTAAAGLGVTDEDVAAFCSRLASSLADVRKKEAAA